MAAGRRVIRSPEESDQDEETPSTVTPRHRAAAHSINPDTVERESRNKMKTKKQIQIENDKMATLERKLASMEKENMKLKSRAQQFPKANTPAQTSGADDRDYEREPPESEEEETFNNVNFNPSPFVSTGTVEVRPPIALRRANVAKPKGVSESAVSHRMTPLPAAPHRDRERSASPVRHQSQDQPTPVRPRSPAAEARRDKNQADARAVHDKSIDAQEDSVPDTEPLKYADGVECPAPRRKKPRYAADFEPSIERLINDSINPFAVHLFTSNAFPEKEKAIQWADHEWEVTCKDAARRFRDSTLIVARVISSRASNIRGNARDAARPLIISTLGIVDEPTSPRKVKDNKSRVTYLLEGSPPRFCYTDIDNVSGFAVSPIVMRTIRKAFFKSISDVGIVFEESLNPLPFRMIAFVHTLIHSCLTEWASGTHAQVRFSESDFNSLYKQHVSWVEAWSKLNKEKARLVLGDLYRKIRKMSKLDTKDSESQLAMSDDTQRKMAMELEAFVVSSDRDTSSAEESDKESGLPNRASPNGDGDGPE